MRLERLHRAGLLVALALVPAYAGCASEQDRYCDAVREHQTELTEIAAAADPGRLLDVVPIYGDLAEQAPRDLDEEWSEVLRAYERLASALGDAGVDPATFDPDEPPADLADEQREAIVDAAARLADPVTIEALAGLQQQARDVCKTPLAR